MVMVQTAANESALGGMAAASPPPAALDGPVLTETSKNMETASSSPPPQSAPFFFSVPGYTGLSDYGRAHEYGSVVTDDTLDLAFRALKDPSGSSVLLASMASWNRGERRSFGLSVASPGGDSTSGSDNDDDDDDDLIDCDEDWDDEVSPEDGRGIAVADIDRTGSDDDDGDDDDDNNDNNDDGEREGPPPPSPATSPSPESSPKSPPSHVFCPPPRPTAGGAPSYRSTSGLRLRGGRAEEDASKEPLTMTEKPRATTAKAEVPEAMFRPIKMGLRTVVLAGPDRYAPTKMMREEGAVVVDDSEELDGYSSCDSSHEVTAGPDNENRLDYYYYTDDATAIILSEPDGLAATTTYGSADLDRRRTNGNRRGKGGRPMSRIEEGCCAMIPSAATIVEGVHEEVTGTLEDAGSAWDQVWNAFTLREDEIDSLAGTLRRVRRDVRRMRARERRGRR